MRTIISVLLVVAAASCSKPVVFQGQTTLAVVGTAPVAEVAPPPRVEVRDNKIEIHEKIQFDLDKATIKPESFSLMDEIGSVITKNPQIKRIQIEGYASSEGDAGHNKKLSDDRAKSVMKYLVDHGIAQPRLTALGFGVDKPIADNATEDGREKNRRVEFSILEQDVTEKKVEIDPKTGAEKVIGENREDVKTPSAASNQSQKRTP
ncbi:MAG TPA: OmpA family protein [Kofleriaceae bacterium]|jgi:OOP family OmpA-OmpF porin|nr:OmpA family protein [Kofleriaceae bacterium]